MNEDNVESMKLVINNVVWMYAPDTTTLKEAENIAIAILCMIRDGKVESVRHILDAEQNGNT